MTEQQLKKLHEQTVSSSVSRPTEKRAERPLPNSLLKELAFYGIKLAVILLVAMLIFTFFYGVHRVNDPGMMPALRDGDLVIFNRFDRSPTNNDLVVLDFEGQRQIRRVVARAGDTVDITGEGLIVNGAIVRELGIYYFTHRFEEGIDFPLTVGEGQVFVLGDARPNATDSRIYGPVNISDTLGTVVTVNRRKKF